MLAACHRDKLLCYHGEWRHLLAQPVDSCCHRYSGLDGSSTGRETHIGFLQDERVDKDSKEKPLFVCWTNDNNHDTQRSHACGSHAPGLWWNMILRRSWSPQVMLSLYFWRRGIKISSHFSATVVMSFWKDRNTAIRGDVCHFDSRNHKPAILTNQLFGEHFPSTQREWFSCQRALWEALASNYKSDLRWSTLVVQHSYFSDYYTENHLLYSFVFKPVQWML